MNDELTISAFQFFERFPDQESGREYLESRLWPGGPRCPVCGGTENITKRKGGYYRCNPCKEDFTVRTGTIFERSHVPLHKWLHCMYLLATARKAISSLELSKELGITQKSAWFVLQRLREACGTGLPKLQGTVEKGFLNRIADKVLSYRPKPVSTPAKKRRRKANKAKRESKV